MIPPLSNPASVLGLELSQEIRALVEDFRGRRPGVQDWEIEQGLTLARQETRSARGGAVAMAVALSAAALLAGLTLAWMGP